ncbi:Integrase family protein [Pseudomonas amygdali pv. morsprunorum]|nr:Integrase family protein [Pseudomonas amygdali pv. morsprunorum]
MTYGVNAGLIFSNPLSGIRSVFKKPKKQNMAALAPGELKELMLTVANASIKKTTRCLIEWQLHTMTRPAEAATARWADIDLKKKIWTIPPERMKKRRTHVIPLTQQALELLEAIKPFSGQ